MHARSLNAWGVKAVEGAKSSFYVQDKEHPIPVNLYQHIFADGRIWFEYVQVFRNSLVGSMIYLAIKDAQGKVVPESLWLEDSSKQGGAA